MDALPRLPAPPGMLLHRFTVKPRHLDDWLALWPAEADGLRDSGFTLHRLFVETDAEPKVTLLASHPEGLFPDGSTLPVRQPAALAPHVFRNAVTRPVRCELLTSASESSIDGRIAIMRRYAIVGGWDRFLAIWERIVPVRERYGFRCLFAVSDVPHDLFTWAFDFAGAWENFPDAQRGYYADPERVSLREVFHHMADYSIHPARQLLL
ncbi:MAG: hypothetical protein Q4F65_08100 [Propionibacteriaceae bacterium]|nr:hypothetical protein [Propionibacteriaceae bacterium]